MGFVALKVSLCCTERKKIQQVKKSKLCTECADCIYL